MASTEQKKCEFLLQGDLNQCKLKHILNSSTGICVDKESMLGKHLTKIQNNTQEVVKIVEKQNNKEGTIRRNYYYKISRNLEYTRAYIHKIICK